MLRTIELLLELQTLDQEALQLKEQMSRYPQIWEEVKKRLAKVKASHEAAVATRDRHQRDRRRVEQKLRLFSEDLRKTQKQQQELRGKEREYQAATKQIDNIKKKMAQAEEQGLELMEKEPELEKAIEETKAEFDKIKAHARSEQDRIREQFNRKKKQHENVEAEREKLRGQVDPEALAVYDRVALRYPGNAVVPVRAVGDPEGKKDKIGKSTCTGCHWQLLPDALVKLHAQKEMCFCPNCDRIFSEDEDYVPVEDGEAG